MVCPTSEKHKLQGPFQQPCKNPCRWHSFHTKAKVGGPLIQILTLSGYREHPYQQPGRGKDRQKYTSCGHIENFLATVREKPQFLELYREIPRVSK